MTRAPSGSLSVKRPYRAPSVADAGSLRNLTFGGSTTLTSDSGSNMMRIV